MSEEDEVDGKDQKDQQTDGEENSVKGIHHLSSSIVANILREIEARSQKDKEAESEEHGPHTEKVEGPQVVLLDTLAASHIGTGNSGCGVLELGDEVSLGAGVGDVLALTPLADLALRDDSEIFHTHGVHGTIALGLVEVTEVEAVETDHEDEQDNSDHTQDEISGAVLEEVDNESEDSENNSDDSNDPETIGDSLGAIVRKGGVLVPVEALKTPVDHDPAVKDKADGGNEESVSGQLKSVEGDAPGRESDVGKEDTGDEGADQHDGQEGLGPPPDGSEAPVIKGAVLPVTLVDIPSNKSAVMHVHKEDEGEGSGQEVDSEDDTSDEGDHGEHGIVGDSGLDFLARVHCPVGAEEGEEHTNDREDEEPGKEILSIKPPHDECDNGGDEKDDSG